MSNKDQDFIIYLNDDLTNGSVFQEFHGSPENDQLLAYQKFMMEQGEQIYHYHQLLGVSTDPEESVSYYKTLDEIDDRIRAYRDQVSADAPSSVLGMVLSVLPEPKLPEELRNPQNKADSLAAREFMSDHFWDDTKFWDGRLANTPFISDKLDRYFAEVLIPESDRVIKSIDKILSNAVADSMFYRLILKKALLGSKAHYFKWDDAVFIHLYENYFASESHDWMSIDDRNDIDKHAFFLMGNTSGAQAPEITLQGLNDKSNKLSEQESEYTILAFWDPTCAHCKSCCLNWIPFIRKNGKEKGIEVFAVGVESDATENEWRSIISEKELSDWTHVYCSRASLMSMAEAGEELLTKQYDVWYFLPFSA